MKKINVQAGFTLIELIMVIVILGVLAAFALPRFADLGSEARTSSIKGLSGAIKAAANIAHAQQLADGGSGTDSVNLEGTDITMVAGYPTADGDGIGTAAQISANDYDADVTTTVGSIIYTIAGFTVVQPVIPVVPALACQVTYTPANAVVTTTVTGC
jgi:MSHA pilin protein MshA